MEDCVEILKIEKPFPIKSLRYDKPSLIGNFSLDSYRNYCDDLSQLQYIRIEDRMLNDRESCRVNFDLNRGRENLITRDDETQDQYNNLLTWVLENNKGKKSVAADVVCFRGVLSMLMLTPYEKQEGWMLCATKFRGTLYLCQFDTDEKREKTNNLTEKDKKFLFWGRKFEKYMCSDHPRSRPDPSAPVNENEELCVIFTSKLNERRLLFGAEIDGVLNCDHEIRGCEDLAQSRLVELKTNRQIDNPSQYNSFQRYKLLKWWVQSHLVGIKYILCGFRNDKGVVQKLRQFNVSKIPDKAKKVWDPDVCMTFCDTFLEFANNVVQEELPHTVWKFEWKPDKDVTAAKIDGPSKYSFLPAWFTEKFSSVVT